MKKPLSILLGVLILLICVVALGAAYVNFAPIPTHEAQVPELRIEADSAMIARGEKLVSLSCALCHVGKKGRAMEGGPWREKDLGALYVANLTRHPESAASRYTDGEMALLLRTGIKQNGEMALTMPRYAHLSDRDLQSIIAFLRSDSPLTAPSDKAWPERELNMLGKVLTRVAIKPLQYNSSVADPDFADPVAHGRYLAHNLACYHCHSADFATVNEWEPEKSEGYFGGGNGIVRKESPEKIPSTNLTPHPTNGLGRYAMAQFGDAVRYGKRNDGSTLDHSMPRFTNLNDEEVGALWAYLQTIPALE